MYIPCSIKHRRGSIRNSTSHFPLYQTPENEIEEGDEQSNETQPHETDMNIPSNMTEQTGGGDDMQSTSSSQPLSTAEIETVHRSPVSVAIPSTDSMGSDMGTRSLPTSPTSFARRNSLRFANGTTPLAFLSCTNDGTGIFSTPTTPTTSSVSQPYISLFAPSSPIPSTHTFAFPNRNAAFMQTHQDGTPISISIREHQRIHEHNDHSDMILQSDMSSSSTAIVSDTTSEVELPFSYPGRVRSSSFKSNPTFTTSLVSVPETEQVTEEHIDVTVTDRNVTVSQHQHQHQHDHAVGPSSIQRIVHVHVPSMELSPIVAIGHISPIGTPSTDTPILTSNTEKDHLLPVTDSESNRLDQGGDSDRDRDRVGEVVSSSPDVPSSADLPLSPSLDFTRSASERESPLPNRTTNRTRTNLTNIQNTQQK